jgi:hypothetical protein
VHASVDVYRDNNSEAGAGWMESGDLIGDCVEDINEFESLSTPSKSN